jgi:23S rRNA U2552 (ribose-2'-O)-methylase RlmE/FtsJ
MKLLDFTTANNTELTDKFHLGLISQVYNKLFTETFTDRVEKVLEIGIQDGRSIKLWRDYFTKAHVYGVDITHCAALENEDRITQIVGNAYSTSVMEELGNNFDLIIDDGPHDTKSQLYFLNNYSKLLNNGGILVLEDIFLKTPIDEYIDIAKQYGKVTLIDLEYGLTGKYLWKLNRKWQCYKALVLKVD